MTSTINPAVPAMGSALSSAPIRAQFLTAANDINFLTGQSAGNTAPTTPITFQTWVDTSTTPPTLRLYDGVQWIVMGTISQTGHVFNLSIGGTAAVTNSQNTPTTFTVSNNSIGTAAESQLIASNGTSQGIFGVTGTSFTPVAGLTANTAFVRADGSTGLALAAPAGPLKFLGPSFAEVARFAATTGNLLLGTTTDGGAKLQVSGAIAGGLGASVANTSTATGASAFFVVGDSSSHSGNFSYFSSGFGGGGISTNGNVALWSSTSNIAVGTAFTGGTTTFYSGNNVQALKLDGSQNATFSGNLIVTTMPTSNPHIVGEMWNNSGVVNISAG